jgi:hypothetical protein
VTSVPAEETVPFVPDAQEIDRLPLAITVTVSLHLPKVVLLTGPLTVPVNVVVFPRTVDSAHVVTVVPELSFIVVEVPALRLSVISTALF